MRCRPALLPAFAVCCLEPVAAAAQRSAADRPFLFSVAMPRGDTRQASVFVDTGSGERSFDLVQSEEPEHRWANGGSTATRSSRTPTAERVAVDLITTFGVARRIAPAVHVGVE